MRPATWAGMAWPSVSHRTMSVVPSARGSLAIASTRSSGTVPSNGQVKDVAMHSWICPLTSCAYSTAWGSAARLSSVVRPMFALLCESDAERQYWKLRAPAAAALATWPGVATQIQHFSSSSG
jgi:hypothetical protein